MRAVAKPRTRRTRAWPVAVAAALWLHAVPSAAARLTAVRVGTHPGYTRVVLETDAPAAYQVLEASTDAPDEVTVQIAAESRARDVAARGPGSPSVTLSPQADGTTLARIYAPGPLRVETQVLATPPRLVLDLRRAANEAALAATAPESEIATPVPREVVEGSPPTLPTPPLRDAESVVADPAPVLAPAAEPSSAPPPDPVPAEPATAIEAPPTVDAPPPVAAPPPRADLAMDPRSLAVGLAVGFGIALIAIAARRQGHAGVVVAPAIEGAAAPPESGLVEPLEMAEAAAAPESEAVDAPCVEAVPLIEVRDDWMLDVLRMHQRLDARLAEIAGRLGQLAERQSRLEARGGAQNEELASQRAAIARLQRSLRPASLAQPPRQVG